MADYASAVCLGLEVCVTRSSISFPHYLQNTPYKCIPYMDQSTLLHGGYEAGDGHLKVDVGCSPSQMILSELILTLL